MSYCRPYHVTFEKVFSFSENSKMALVMYKNKITLFGFFFKIFVTTKGFFLANIDPQDIHSASLHQFNQIF